MRDMSGVHEDEGGGEVEEPAEREAADGRMEVVQKD